MKFKTDCWRLENVPECEFMTLQYIGDKFVCVMKYATLSFSENMGQTVDYNT